MASSCPATAAELMLNLEGTGMNRSGVSGSNFDVSAPASSPLSTTSSAVVSAASSPPSDGKQAKDVRRKTKIPNKQKQHQQQLQLLVQICTGGIQQLQQYQLLQQPQHPQQLNQHLHRSRVQLNQSAQTTFQDPVQVAAFVQQNVAQLKKRRQELEQQAETNEAQLRQSYEQLLKHMKKILQFMLRGNHQESQLPSTERSAVIQLPPDQSSFGSAESATSAAATVAPEPAMEYNMDPSVVPPPSASEEPKTSPTGTSLDADMNADSGMKNKSIPLPSHQITPTNTLGFDSAGHELNDGDGGANLGIFQPTINVLEVDFLTSNSPAGSSSVAPICSASIPAPHQMEASTAGQCNQPMLSPTTLDPEANSNHHEALSLACSGGKEEMVELLLSKGTIIEHRDKKGLTPLMLAATAGHDKVVEVLLNHGANIEAKDGKTKDTALALACSGGHYKVVKLLLKRGANKENHNLDDYTPLTMAASGNHVDIIKLLLSNDAKINSRTDFKLGLSPLMMAAQNGHVEAVRILSEMGSDVNAFEMDGYTALTLACYYGKIEVVRILLEKKANVEQRTKQGLTPLQLSASVGNAEVGRVLLDYGADVNAPPVPSSRDTALTLASDNGLVQLVELLLQHDAQVNVKTKQGNSPLWLAANSGHLQVVEILYKAKADIDFKNNFKVSCLMAAFRKGHVQLVEWMVKRVTQFPSDEEFSRILPIADIDLLPKCQLCKEIIRAAKDHQVAEANKNAAHLLKELDMEKRREDLKRTAAAKKREKKKLKKLDKQRAESDHIDNNWQQQGNDFDDGDDKSYTRLKTADLTTSNNKETEDGKSEKSSKNSSPDKATEMQLKQTKKSLLRPHVESNVKADDSQKLSKRGNKRNKENVSSNIVQYRTKCTNDESSSNSIKSFTSTSISSPKKPTKKEEEWKEVVRRRPLSSQENSGSVAGTTKKSQPGDQSSATLSIIHSSERCKKVTVPLNAIGRVIGQAGCNISAIREVSGALVEIDKPRKGQNHRTVIIKGMPEYISQAQRLISVLLNEPENKFYELLTEFKANGTGSSNQACTSLNKGTTITGSVSHSKGTIAATIPVITSASILIPTRQNPQNPVVSALLTSAVKMGDKLSDPTTPLPSSNMNASAPYSLPMMAASVAGNTRSNLTSPDQDLHFNHPQAAGTSLSDISERAVNVVDPAKAQGYRENLTPSSSSVKALVGSRLHLLSSPSRSGSPTLDNPIPIQPLIPIGNCYLPPPPQQKSIIESGVKEKDPPTSIASLDPGGVSASKTRKRRKRPHKKTQHHLPQFDGGSIPNLNGMASQGNDPMERQRPTFSLAPGVGRPSIGRLGYTPMFGGGASSLSIIPANFGSNEGMHIGPMNGGDMQQPPCRMPRLKLGPEYPVSIGKSYYDKQPMMSYLGQGLGPGAVNRMSDSPPNQLGFLELSTKYQSALAATSTVCRVCYGTIMGTSFRCIRCEDYNMCCVCVTSGKHPQHPVVRTIASTADRDTDNITAFVTSMKRDRASTSLVEKLLAKIAEQNVKMKEQDAKMKEKDVEIEYLVSAHSDAVALLSRRFDRTLGREKKEKDVEPSQGLL